MYGIIIKPDRAVSQFRQLYEQLRDKIISGEIPVSAKLASSRDMATEFHLSRAVVLEVIDQLKVEGYLETRHGSGTYITPGLDYLAGKEEKRQASLESSKAHVEKSDTVSFISGLPDLSLFPRRGWNKAYGRALEYAQDEELSYGGSRGNPLLREVLAGFLFRSKGIRTRPDNILITSGAAQGISLLADVMSRSGRRVILEDPLVSFVYDIFSAYGCRPDFADVDEEGIVPESISARGASLIYVSPSHQFPLGGTLSARRRIQLLNAISASDCLIIEDDYDGEFRYGCRSIAPLQVLAPERVIYIGTFSKNLAPALRLGYMVVPEQLLDQLKKLKRRFDLLTEGLSQLAMARFISEGLLERHITRMRKVYQKRKERIEDLLLKTFGDSVEISGQTTGLHLVLRFPGYHFRKDMPGELLKKGLKVEPVSRYCIRTKAHGDKLVLGYGQVRDEEIVRGVSILQEYLAGIKRGV